jgi:hypothetical protein
MTDYEQNLRTEKEQWKEEETRLWQAKQVDRGE